MAPKSRRLVTLWRIPLTTCLASPNRIRKVRSRTQSPAPGSPGVEHLSGFPEFLQNVQQTQHQGDAEGSFDQNLQSSLAVGERRACLDSLRITALHLPDDSVLAFEQLAHTRLFSRRGGVCAQQGIWRWLRNRLFTPCSGLRTQGARVSTAGPVAILLRLAF